MHKVLEDPNSVHCLYRSSSRTAQVPFDIQIRQLPCTGFTHYIWIKLTGPRPDSLSPAPSFDVCTKGEEVESATPVMMDTRRLPESVKVWAVPSVARGNGRIFYRVYVTPPEHHLKPLFERAEQETGRECTVITSIDFEERFSEEKVRRADYSGLTPQILTTLVDCFADILTVRPPSEQTNDGWVFECAGPRDVEDLLRVGFFASITSLTRQTVSTMPGLTIRRATPEESAKRPLSLVPTQASKPTPSSESHQSSGHSDVATSDEVSSNGSEASQSTSAPARTPSVRGSQQAPSEHVASNASQPAKSEHVPSHTSQHERSQHVASNVSQQAPSEHFTSNVSQTPSAVKAAEAAPPSESQFSLSMESNHPGLVRTLVLTYRGRQLREEIKDGASRYIDDAAIFVGRLVKGRETEFTLLKRFERYGNIVSAAAVAQGQAHALTLGGYRVQPCVGSVGEFCLRNSAYSLPREDVCAPRDGERGGWSTRRALTTRTALRRLAQP